MTSRLKLILSAAAIVLVGSGVGFGLSRSKVANASKEGTISTGTIKTSTEAGYTDTKLFESIVTGIIKKGGLFGEGTHSLVQDSNPKNPAALLSSVVDLDEYVGKHVQIWGRSQRAVKAAWLLEIGRIKILE